MQVQPGLIREPYGCPRPFGDTFQVVAVPGGWDMPPVDQPIGAEDIYAKGAGMLEPVPVNIDTIAFFSLLL